MIDKSEIYDDLVEAFIVYQYELNDPFHTDSIDMMAMQYRKDQIFKTKVNRLVTGIMFILDRHI